MNELNKFSLSPVYCLHNGAVILEQKETFVRIGLVNLNDEMLKGRLTNAALRYSLNTEFVKVTQDEFRMCVSSFFVKKEKKENVQESNSSEEKKSTNVAAAVLDSLIMEARAFGATDIHIDKNIVRYRTEGVLTGKITFDKKNSDAVIQRIKLLAKMNVMEKRHVQDGQFKFTDTSGHNVFVRVSCLPSISSDDENSNESVVLRLLDTAKVPLKLEKLGFNFPQLEMMEKFCSLKDGLILICGATSSGKSTTAAAMLEKIRFLCDDGKKIISLEDPPEYYLEGITQVRIQNGYEMDFETVLKSSLRQDPDVIFIGEIRDSITARIAVQASLTGHLVIATLHVGTISQALLRLIDLDAKAELVRAVLKGIVLQKIENGVMSARIRHFETEKDCESYGGEKYDV